RRKVDRPAWRTLRHADRLAHCRARSRLDRLRRSSRRLPRGLAAARRRPRCDPLRSRLCHARSHLRPRRPAADHRAHPCPGPASAVSWPGTHVLVEAVRWRGTYLVYAALLALVAAPLHAFALPRARQRRGAVRPIGARGERRAAADRLAFPL